MSDPQSTAKRTFVLVPGAWLGAWSWHPVARRLRENGNEVVALTMPGLSYGSSPRGLRLDDAVDFVVRQVEERDLHDVVLVAHSWGGYPVTGAASRLPGRVAKVIYYSAVVPEKGAGMSDENEEYGSMIRESIAATPDQTVPLPIEALRYGLMPDGSPELQDLVHAMLLPQPGRYMTDSLDVPPVTEAGIPPAYLVGAGDNALARPAEVFAARLGLKPVVVPGGHMGLLLRPDEIAAAIMAAA